MLFHPFFEMGFVSDARLKRTSRNRRDHVTRGTVVVTVVVTLVQHSGGEEMPVSAANPPPAPSCLHTDPSRCTPPRQVLRGEQEPAFPGSSDHKIPAPRAHLSTHALGGGLNHDPPPSPGPDWDHPTGLWGADENMSGAPLFQGGLHL